MCECGRRQVALANAFNIDTSVSISFQSYPASSYPLAAGLIDFESRDAFFDPLANGAAATVQQHAMIPIMAAGVVPVYNLEKYQPLTFSRAALSGLFLGSVTAWDDPALAATNPGASLAPQAPVRLVSGDDAAQTGVPAAFLRAIRSFANLSAGAGPSPAAAPSLQVWPAEGIR